jgi:hypothetical protein
LQYRAPRLEHHTLPDVQQLQYHTPQVHRAPLQHSPNQNHQTLAIPGQVSRMNTSPVLPEQPQFIPIPIQYNTPSPIGNAAEAPTTALSRMDTSPGLLKQPQLMDYSNIPIQYNALLAVGNTTAPLALPPPVEGDCEDCAVTEYVKYNESGIVALPHWNSCNTNFENQIAFNLMKRKRVLNENK